MDLTDNTANEIERGCGHRKIGGVYAIGGKPTAPCGGLPVFLRPCKTCGQTINFARNFQWIPRKFIHDNRNPEAPIPEESPFCTICRDTVFDARCEPTDRVGVIWIGEQFYKTPEVFMAEAQQNGICRRLSSIPRGLVPGKTLVFFAHQKVGADRCECCGIVDGESGAERITRQNACKVCGGKGELPVAGLFSAFIPEKFEMVVDAEMAEEKWVERLVKRHTNEVTGESALDLVLVDGDDPRFQRKGRKRSERERAFRRVQDAADEKVEAEDGGGQGEAPSDGASA